MNLAADLDCVKQAIELAEREGRHDDADSLAITSLRRIIEQAVCALGQGIVRRAVRHQAGATEPVAPEQLSSAGKHGDGRLARALLLEVLAMTKPLFDPLGFEMLAGAVQTIGKSATVKTVLDLDRPSHIRGNPAYREQAIMATCAVAIVLFTAARGNNPDGALAGLQAEAQARMKQLRINTPKPGSLEVVERRLLAEANAAMEGRTWQRAKSEVSAELRAGLDILPRLIAGSELTPEQNIILADEHGQGAIKHYLALAGFSRSLDAQVNHIRALWRRSRES